MSTGRRTSNGVQLERGRSTRRDRLRRELETAIDEAAARQLSEVGPAALSLREIARDVGLSPAAIYHYVDGRDALLTRLIVRGFESLAGELERAAARRDGEAIDERIMRTAQAYRRWALRDPSSFALVFGGPVAGYVAPEHGPTTRAADRVGSVFASLMDEARSVDRFEPLVGRPAMHRGGPGTGEGDHGVGGDPSSLVAQVGLWGRVHGLVSLECFGHLAWLGTEAEAVFSAEVGAALAELGVTTR